MKRINWYKTRKNKNVIAQGYEYYTDGLHFFINQGTPFYTLNEKGEWGIIINQE